MKGYLCMKISEFGCDTGEHGLEEGERERVIALSYSAVLKITGKYNRVRSYMLQYCMVDSTLVDATPKCWIFIVARSHNSS